jgi:hypothetical protein
MSRLDGPYCSIEELHETQLNDFESMFRSGVAVAKGSKRRSSLQNRPIAGTRLIREWRGAEHNVTVRQEDFEYRGLPYKSLSAIARAITGTRWNGLVFFGLKNKRGH